jgi:hypothetical protein
MKNCVCGRAQEANLICGLCQELYCKKCIEFLPLETFSFMHEIPKELKHTQYCLTCYGDKVRAGLVSYNEIMKRAKQVLILDRPRRKPLTILKKLKDPLRVEDCPDREETILRLAFLAAELGYYSVIRVNVTYKKVRNAGYQKMVWHGTGLAVELDDHKLD